MTAAPEVLRTPSADRVPNVERFRDWLRGSRGLDLANYDELWRWSVTDLPAFWDALAEFCGVRFRGRADVVLGSAAMPGASWFPGATLNYAEHALTGAPGDALAIVFRREDGVSARLTYRDLRSRVAAARAALIGLGVRRGDRVAALVPNSPDTIVAFLAAASIGATWASCSPDFGGRAVSDRFSQIEPTVLIAVDGYLYNGRHFDVRPTVEQLRADISSLKATVLISYTGSSLPGTISWAELVAEHEGAPLAFDPLPFDHPLWVLYSSGTTGLPKGIVQGHGGIVLEHLKALSLHCDIGPGKRFFWFTTTGWMMWNFLVSGLLAGAAIVLYDGSPAHPGPSVLWELAARERITYFSTSAPYVQSCIREGLRPADQFDLSALRAIGSTGSPLPPEGFRWLADAVGSGIQIEEVGELVITAPMPSMPLSFWNDPDGSRLRAAYFEMYPGVWRHGDWIKITDRGSAVIYGRSDSTLNRGGVRMGTAEFYRVIENLDKVLDSLVIDTTGNGRSDGELLCFVVLAPGAALADIEPGLRAALREQLSPRHVPNRFFAISAVPRTLSGKKCEVPVKRILAGVAVDQAVSKDALRDPDALRPFVALAKA
jgi:acetoacetyl-CoA synthetase